MTDFRNFPGACFSLLRLSFCPLIVAYWLGDVLVAWLPFVTTDYTSLDATRALEDQQQAFGLLVWTTVFTHGRKTDWGFRCWAALDGEVLSEVFFP